MENIDQSPKVAQENTKEELNDKDVEFITRFNLTKEDLRYKCFAHDEEATA